MKNHTIFIVDNSKLQQDMISLSVKNAFPKTFPENSNFTIHKFSNPKDALSSVAELNPAIIITEYTFDEALSIDGLELLKQVKNINPKIKVIAYTKQTDFWVATQFHLWQAADYIAKVMGSGKTLTTSVRRHINLIEAEQKND